MRWFPHLKRGILSYGQLYLLGKNKEKHIYFVNYGLESKRKIQKCIIYCMINKSVAN